jgi:hypothetical protein
VETPDGGEGGLAVLGQQAISLADFTSLTFNTALACNRDCELANMDFADPTGATIVLNTVTTGGGGSEVLRRNPSQTGLC